MLVFATFVAMQPSPLCQADRAASMSTQPALPDRPRNHAEPWRTRSRREGANVLRRARESVSSPSVSTVFRGVGPRICEFHRRARQESSRDPGLHPLEDAGLEAPALEGVDL